MPSGRMHDAITVLLAAPAGMIAYAASGEVRTALVVTAGFLLGGLMFGPDLDTVSRQYSRWSFLKFLWFPYRTFFKHRSRWSHGFLFGTLLRVIYFMGVATCFAFVISYAYTVYVGGESLEIWRFAQSWATLRRWSDAVLGELGALMLVLGLWAGAASHSVTDLAGTYIRTGRARL